MKTTETTPRTHLGTLLVQNKLVILAAVLLVLILNSNLVLSALVAIPITLIVIWILLRLSREGWAGIGIRRPTSWPRTIALGVGVAVVMQIFVIFVLLPTLERFGIPGPDLSSFDAVRGNPAALLLFLGVSWTTAGFGEEIIWRGFLMPRVAKVLGESNAAWGVSLILTSITFGLLHNYQGTVGMVMTGFAGLVLGIVYLASGRNLWAAIITHGSLDTLSSLILYLGWWERLS